MPSIQKIWKSCLLIILMLFLTLVFTSFCLAEEQKQYTVMYYICGADLERDGGQFTASMGSILATHYNRDEVNAVGLLGGTPRWSGNTFDPQVLSIVEIAGRRPHMVDNFPLASMSDSATLSSFLTYCQEHYPAEHYILVICDHGGGPLLGCCSDFLFNHNTMSLNSLKDALENSPFADRGLDIIAFNCCLMGSVEIANSISPYAQYMVATEDAMYGIGHSWLKDVEKDETVAETARRIAESTYQNNKEIIERQHASELNSVSVIDLQALPDLVSVITDYFADLPQLDESMFVSVSDSRKKAVDFGVLESGGNSQYDLVDIGSLVSSMKIESDDTNRLMEAVIRAVPYHYADVNNCAGMTIYHPYLNKDAAKQYMKVYADLGFSPSYVNYVIKYASIMIGDPLANWENLLIDMPASQRDNRVLFSLKLTDAQAVNLGSSRMYVLQKDQNDSYRFTYLSSSTGLKDTVLSGEFSGTALYAVDSDGTPLTKALPYRISSKGIWLIPAELKKDSGEDEHPLRLEALIYCVLDTKTKELLPGGIAVWDEVTQSWNANFTLSYEDFDEITIRIPTRRETRDDRGILLPFDKWVLAEEESWNSVINGTWTFRLLNDTIDPEGLYAAFELQDSQGNMYSSELHVVRTGVSTADELRVEYDDLDLIKIDQFSVSMSDQLIISADVINLAEQEAFIRMQNLEIDGNNVNTEVEINGTGPNWGLLQDEKQFLSLAVPDDILAGKNVIENISFNLVLIKSDDFSELGLVPVRVSLRLDMNRQQ